MKIKLGNIAYAVVQMVGNKTNGEGVAFSSEKINLCDIKNILFELFDKSLKYDDLKRLDFVGGVQLNPVYNFVSSIFEDENSFIQEANNLATYLYQQSLHPSIKNGEFYVMKINDCIVDGDKVDAVGLFKSELHDTVLKVINNSNGIQIIPENGMSLKKLDKGCVVFNKRRCVISLWRPPLIFCLFTDTKSLKNIFIYNKAQTFTSSGFAFPQKICIFAENFFKYGKDTNKI